MSDQRDDRPTDRPSGPPATAPLLPPGPVQSAAQPGPYRPPTGPATMPFPAPMPGQTPVQVPGPTPGHANRPPRANVPGWLLPVIGGIALVLGFGGGALAAVLITNHDDDPGVLKVERRTAPPLAADNTSVAAVAEKVLPSTVQIIAEYRSDPQGATGSGFVFDRSGHVITNNHVVADAAKDDGPITVIDHGGKRLKASIVGRSAVYDIAVLKVSGAQMLTPVAIGSSDQMRVGETVVAIGSPLGLTATVTSGIISAVHRPVTTGTGDDSSFINAVQTDAAINPGNSGGPLVNLQGQVVGVNSAIASLGASSGQEGGNIGVGFAIPIEQVQVTTDEILRTGKVVYPVIGANIVGTDQRDGARVTGVSSGGPAAKAGLRTGDVIRKIDGEAVSGSSDLVVAIRSHVPGDRIELTYERGGKSHDAAVTLGSQTE